MNIDDNEIIQTFLNVILPLLVTIKKNKCLVEFHSGNQQIHRSMLCDDIDVQYVAVRKETFDLLLRSL